MTFLEFQIRVSKVVGRLGFSAEYHDNGNEFIANISDGTIIRGSSNGSCISLTLYGDKTIRIDSDRLA